MVTRLKIASVILAAMVFLLQPDASMAQTDWTKYSHKPVFEVGAAGAWDAKKVETGSVYFDNATYHLWYTGSDGKQWRIGYATSPDGITWTRYAGNPVLEPGTAGTWEDYGVYSPSVVHDGSKFHMWYTGFGAVVQIGHATSDDGITWTRDPANPVVSAGAGALSWDGGGAYLPSVVYAQGEFKMWYTGGGGRTMATIGYAASPDGTVWTQYGTNPVLTASDAAQWDGKDVVCPSVVFDGSTYHLWYAAWHEDFRLVHLGYYKIGYASSPDGLAWTKYDGNPVLRPSARLLSGFDGRGINYPVVILNGDQFQMWYTGDGHWGKAHREEIGYATSPVDAQ